jgi:hypothetical protein
MISELSLNAILRKKHNRINGYINSISNYPSKKKVFKEYSPIKPTDISLEKYLKLKKEFLLKNGNSEKIRNSRVIF